MEFRPCIDLHDGRVVQIVGSTLRDGESGVSSDSETLVENFVSECSPSYFAELFRRDNLHGGHVIMLGKGNEQAAMEALNAFPGGLHVGGGINPANAGKYLTAGASHVIITSYVFTGGTIDFRRLEEMVKAVGKERLVLDLSCKKMPGGTYTVMTDRWQRYSDYSVSIENLTLLSDYCDEFLVHGVGVEGKKSGIDQGLVEILGKAGVKIPITYAGGIANLDDIGAIFASSEGRVNFTVGSALDIYGGNLKYDDVLKTVSSYGALLKNML